MGANVARLSVEHVKAEAVRPVTPSSHPTFRLAIVHSVKQSVSSLLTKGSAQERATDTDH
jgi:hypothetical protein